MSIEDVHNELIQCYNAILENGTQNGSEQLYAEHFFFCNTNELLDSKIQQRIKEYNYCKSFNCPPYPSLAQTPAKVVDEFLEIENIMVNIKRDKYGR